MQVCYHIKVLQEVRQPLGPKPIRHLRIIQLERWYRRPLDTCLTATFLLDGNIRSSTPLTTIEAEAEAKTEMEAGAGAGVRWGRGW